MEKNPKVKDHRVTISAKYYIDKIISHNTEGKNVNNFLKEFLSPYQNDTIEILNYLIRCYYLDHASQVEYRKKYDKFPPTNETGKMWWKEITIQYPYIHTAMISTIVQTARARWGTDLIDVIYKRQKSLPVFKKGYPILCHNCQWDIQKVNNAYIMTIRLQSIHKGQPLIVKLNTKFKKTTNYQVHLDNVINGQTKKSMLKIIQDKKNKKWCVVITYKQEDRPFEMDSTKILGVDLGITHVVYSSVDEYTCLAFPGKDLVAIRNKIDIRRRNIQNHKFYSNRNGKGRKKVLEPTQKLQKAIDNFRNTKYHIISRQLLEFAKKNNVSVIQLENLDQLKKQKQESGFMLRNWNIFDFHNKLEYKAKAYGIEIKYVNPAYTSQRCYKCGNINSENRKTQESFKCTECGWECNADKNASLNLSIEDIDKKINLNVYEEIIDKYGLDSIVKYVKMIHMRNILEQMTEEEYNLLESEDAEETYDKNKKINFEKMNKKKIIKIINNMKFNLARFKGNIERYLNNQKEGVIPIVLPITKSKPIENKINNGKKLPKIKKDEEEQPSMF